MPAELSLAGDVHTVTKQPVFYRRNMLSGSSIAVPSRKDLPVWVRCRGSASGALSFAQPIQIAGATCDQRVCSLFGGVAT